MSLTDDQKELAEKIKAKFIEVHETQTTKAEEVANELRMRGLEVPASMGELVYDLVTQQTMTLLKMVEATQAVNTPLVSSLLGSVGCATGAGRSDCAAPVDGGIEPSGGCGDVAGVYGVRRLLDVYLRVGEQQELRVPVRNLTRYGLVLLEFAWSEQPGAATVEFVGSPARTARTQLRRREETVVRATVRGKAEGLTHGTIEVKVRPQGLDGDGNPETDDITGKPVFEADPVETIEQPFELIVAASATQSGGNT